MNEILIIYLMISNAIGFLLLPIIYIEKFSTPYNDIMPECFVIGIVGLFLGWLVFPIMFLIGLKRVIRRILGKNIND